MSARRIAQIVFYIDIRVLEQQGSPDDFVRWRAVEELNAWGAAAAARDEAMPRGWRYVVNSPQNFEIKLEINGPGLQFRTFRRWADFMFEINGPGLQFRTFRRWADFMERSRMFMPSVTISARAEMVAVESERARARRRGEAWDSLRHELNEGQLSLPTTPELIRRVSEEPVLDGGNDIWSRVASAMRMAPRQLNPNPIYCNDQRFSRLVDTARGHDRAHLTPGALEMGGRVLTASHIIALEALDTGRALFFERAWPCPWSASALQRWTVQPYLQRSLVDGGRRWKGVRWRSRRRPWETWCEVLRVPLNHAATTDRMAGRALFGVEHPAEFGEFAGLCDKYKNRPENLAANRRLLLQLGAGKFSFLAFDGGLS